MSGTTPDVRRIAAAEFVGTGFLVAIVVGSGIMATHLTPDVGLQLLINSVVTGAGLAALIATLAPVSASFNPVVSLVAWVLGRESRRVTAIAIMAQVSGGIAGAITANLMFDRAAVTWSQTERSGSHLWLAEGVATAGLVLVIFGAIATNRAAQLPLAVGGYITAAYWFTSSTSFANPAVTIGRMFSDSFAGIEPGSVPMFVVMQVVGGALGLLAVRATFSTGEVSA